MKESFGISQLNELATLAHRAGWNTLVVGRNQVDELREWHWSGRKTSGTGYDLLKRGMFGKVRFSRKLDYLGIEP